MKPYEFMRIYQTKLGIFVSKLEGSSLIVDNIFKPKNSVVSSVVKKIVKPAAKKALTSGTEHIGKKVGDKRGDLITKKNPQDQSRENEEESTDILINRLISGSGMKNMSKLYNRNI